MAETNNIDTPALRTRSSWMIGVLPVLGALATSILSIAYGPKVALYVSAFLLFVFLFQYPEVLLTLFVFAGIFKTYPALSLPFNLDWTAAMGILAVFAMAVRAAVIGKRIRIAIIKTDLFIVGLVLVLGFGLMYSRDPAYGIERVLELLLFGLLASYFLPRIIAAFSSPKKIVRNVMLTIVALAGITSLATFLGLGTGNRAFSGSYLSWSYFLGIAIISGWALISLTSSSLLRIAIVILEPVFLVSMILAKARGPMISLVVVGVLVLFWKGRVSIGKKISVLVVFVSVLAVVFAAMPDAFWSRYERLFAEEKGSSIEARLDAYAFAGQLFAENPLLGAGTGSFRPLFADAESPYLLSYAHSSFLEVAAENGMLGLFFYTGFLISLFLLARRVLKDSDKTKIVKKSTYGCLLVFFFLLVGSQFSGAIIGRNELLFAGLLVLMGSTAKQHMICEEHS
jgi:O-antigen ligase